MDTRGLAEILDWTKTTDLVELEFRQGSEGFEFRLESAGPPVEAAFPICPLVAVTSDGVGFFRFNLPGRHSRIAEGGDVVQAEPLGLIETGAKPLEVRAPRAGRIAKILVQDGVPVQYGQALFLIEPK